MITTESIPSQTFELFHYVQFNTEIDTLHLYNAFSL